MDTSHVGKVTPMNSSFGVDSVPYAYNMVIVTYSGTCMHIGLPRSPGAVAPFCLKICNIHLELSCLNGLNCPTLHDLRRHLKSLVDREHFINDGNIFPAPFTPALVQSWANFISACPLQKGEAIVVPDITYQCEDTVQRPDQTAAKTSSSFCSQLPR